MKMAAHDESLTEIYVSRWVVVTREPLASTDLVPSRALRTRLRDESDYVRMLCSSSYQIG